MPFTQALAVTAQRTVDKVKAKLEFKTPEDAIAFATALQEAGALLRSGFGTPCLLQRRAPEGRRRLARRPARHRQDIDDGEWCSEGRVQALRLAYATIGQNGAIEVTVTRLLATMQYLVYSNKQQRVFKIVSSTPVLLSLGGGRTTLGQSTNSTVIDDVEPNHDGRLVTKIGIYLELASLVIQYPKCLPFPLDKMTTPQRFKKKVYSGRTYN